MITFIKSLGFLRFFLLSLVVMLIISAPFVGETSVKEGWKILPTLIFPAMVPMFFFVLPLDMTMCAVMMEAKPDDVKNNYKKIIYFEAILMLVLLLAWTPFVYRLIFI